jgi:hypothetical protein
MDHRYNLVDMHILGYGFSYDIVHQYRKFLDKDRRIFDWYKLYPMNIQS